MKLLPRLFVVLAGVASALSSSAAELARPRILGISHAAFYVADMAKARAFYEGFLGYASPFSIPLGSSGNLVWIKINDRQSIELFPAAGVATDADRLNHVALEVDDAEAMRLYLQSRGVAVPAQTPVGRIGNKNFFIKDPNGNTLEIVEYLADGWTARDRGQYLPATRISTRMRHVGVMVGQFDASMKFYRDILGFTETWRGSRGQTLDWVNLQVPDGTDYLEFMLYNHRPTRDDALIDNHMCLEVDDVAQAGAVLQGRVRPAGVKPPTPMKTGLNRKRQINYFDPDGTRIEIMEPDTVDGRPVPSSSAPPPAPLPPYRPASLTK